MQTTLCCAWDVSVTTASKNRCATVAVITAVGAKHHRTSGAVAVITACWGPEHHKTSPLGVAAHCKRTVLTVHSRQVLVHRGGAAIALQILTVNQRLDALLQIWRRKGKLQLLVQL